MAAKPAHNPITIGAIDLGEAIAERVIELSDSNESVRRVMIRLGAPIRLPEGDYRCPFQVIGLGDDRVRAPWGEDPFIALGYALQMVGQTLDGGLERHQLRIAEHHEAEVGAHWAYASNWIFRYPVR